MSAKDARNLARALVNVARSIESVSFVDSRGCDADIPLASDARQVARVRQYRPCYQDSNPKIDLYTAAGYAFSTNYWRTCRDALAYYRQQMPERGFTRATIDKRNR